jgi:hypothetical protein
MFENTIVSRNAIATILQIKKSIFHSMNYPDRIELVLTYKHDPKDTEIFTEKVDAVKAGAYYKLVDVPAFAPNIAYGDIVKVKYDDGDFHFDELIEESGYSVAHVVIWKQDSKEHLTNTLSDIGCCVNAHVADNYLVVRISPELPYQPVRGFLDEQKSNGNIDFRDCLSKVHAASV